MANWKDPEWLLGRRFVTDFQIVAIGDDPERTVTLWVYGERYQLAFAELVTLIESGFVAEWPPPKKERWMT